MELIYLWVENYKNIHRQGFNFSPRFECEFKDEYDEEGKLKDNCELIICDKKKKECKDNDYIENFFGDNINVTAIVGKNGSGKSSVLELILESIEEDNNINYILVFEDSTKELKYMTNIVIETKLGSSSELKNMQNIFVYSKSNHAHYAFRKYNLIEINKKSIVNILATEYGKPCTLFEISTFMYLPLKIEIKLREPNELIMESKNFISPLDRESIQEEFLLLNDKYHQFLFISYIRKMGVKYDKKILNDKVKLIKETNNLISEIDFNKYFLTLLPKNIFDITKLTEVEKNIYIREKGYSHFFNFDMIDEEERRFNHLSHGEQMMFGQLLNFYFFSNSKNEHLIFLLDEPEVALHPNWQKQYLNEVITLCQKMKKQYHFIFTSHSPFLLSDIPKQNIIFLDKEENGNSKVVNGLKDKKQTFGANIHTLLSDSFFMEDGLMGEFAKGKIEEVIDYLNNKESPIKDNDEAQKLINIIGEPIIKNQLQKMLDSKRLSKIDEIDTIRTEINDLEKRLKEIEDANDKS